MTTGLNTKTIREIALETPAAVPVFEDFKIDYCCGGDVKFEAACDVAKISPKLVEERLEEVLKSAEKRNASAEQEWTSPRQLIDYILEKHHIFTRDALERLMPLADKVVGKHGERHMELLVLQRLFRELSADLIPHMEKEERILFPFIKITDEAATGDRPFPAPPFGTVANPIGMMRTEHDSAGALLKEMRNVTNDYELPADACPSFTALYFGLEELEKDLHFHIHLENNVLFPKAVELEQALVGV